MLPRRRRHQPRPARKITFLSGRAAAPAEPAPGPPVTAGRWSGGLGDGDGETEGFELADVIAGLAVLVSAAGVVAGAQLVVPGGGIGEQVPDDDQDGAGDGDQGLELADALHQPPVTLAKEGVGLGRCGGCLAEGALEVGIALAGLAGPAPGPGLD